MNDQQSGASRWIFVLVAIALVVATVSIGWGIGRYRRSAEPAPLPTASKRGALLYHTSCATCHGPDGEGDGVAAAALKPPPRDFAARPWRFEPTKASIRQVILAGIPGTAMPASKGNFSDTDLDALVEHVLLLATSRLPDGSEISPAGKKIKAAGFVSLLGSDPPPLQMTDASGRVLKLSDYKGKLVIVNFWGTTCVHCLKEIPYLCELESKYGSHGLTLLHVCADADDAKQAQELLDQHVPGVRALTDETGLSVAKFEVHAMPTTWLIGPDAKSIGRASGTLDWRSPAMTELLDYFLRQR